MPAPLPSVFSDLINQSDTPACVAFKRSVDQVPQKLYDLVNYMFTSEGVISEAFATLIRESANTDPIGTIKIFGGITLPDGYLWCDGTEYNKDDKPSLFNAIGYRFTPDAVDGQSGFNVPASAGRMLIGAIDSSDLGTSTDNDFSELSAAVFNHYHVVGYRERDSDGSKDYVVFKSNGLEAPAGEVIATIPAGDYQKMLVSYFRGSNFEADDTALEAGIDQQERFNTSAPWDDSGRLTTEDTIAKFLPSRLAINFIIKE